MSRKTRLDEGKKREILAIITFGCSRSTAARYVGCDPKTIYNEIRRDKSFAAEIARAEEQSEVFYIQQIRNAAKKESNWRAAAWVLERRIPNRYANRGAETLTFEQVESFIRGLAANLFEEISDKAERERIKKRLARMLLGLAGSAIKRTRIEPENESSGE